MASSPQRFRLIKTLWGVTETSRVECWPHLFERIKADGFDGIELCIGPFFPFTQDRDRFHRLLQASGLALVAQIHTCGYPVSSGNVQDHIASFATLAEQAARWQPVLINSHSGKDSFSRADAMTFFTASMDVERQIGIPIAHETHRQRILHSPFAYRDLMSALPRDLKLTADLSHWVVGLERCMSSERDAEFWPAVLDDVAARTSHIHARVGWAQSPQVADPEAPEHHADVEAHFSWWDTIVRSMRMRNVDVTIEPEFGPYPYLAALPYTKMPVADLWDVNSKFGKRLQERYRTASNA